MMVKIFKIPAAGLIIAIIIFIAYQIKYQQIVNEGTDILNQYCTTVEPKGETLRQAYYGTADKYFAAADDYVVAHKMWQEKQKEFLDRKDYQFFTPSYVREISDLRYEAGNKNIELQEALHEWFVLIQFAGEELIHEVFDDDILPKLNEKNEAFASLDEALENYAGKRDIRHIFIKMPDIECMSSGEPKPVDIEFPELLSSTFCSTTLQCPKLTLQDFRITVLLPIKHV